MDILNAVTTYLSALLANRPALAVLVGLICTLGLTQWIKFVLTRSKRLPDPQRWILDACALPIGAVSTYLILPAEFGHTVRVLIGISVGASAPLVYVVITQILYRIWPGLEGKISFTPADS